MKDKRCYREAPPGVDISRMRGLLVVVEGPDSVGRSTQIELLGRWLEEQGYSVTSVELTKSPVVGPELQQAKQGNVLSARTMSLFYATDFYDQLENSVVPALRAGMVVLCDRYIFTLMARDLVRGAEPTWVELLYSMAIIPDVVFYLQVSMPVLVQRTLRAHSRLDYWESGMDLGLSRDWFDCFVAYQQKMRAEFGGLAERYGFVTINANRRLRAIQGDLRQRLASFLDSGTEETPGGGRT